MPPLERVLVANRGEIAVRIIRACFDEGVETTAEFARDVLAHPDVERGAVHTRWLEEVFLPYWPVAEVAA